MWESLCVPHFIHAYFSPKHSRQKYGSPYTHTCIFRGGFQVWHTGQTAAPPCRWSLIHAWWTPVFTQLAHFRWLLLSCWLVEIPCWCLMLCLSPSTSVRVTDSIWAAPQTQTSGVDTPSLRHRNLLQSIPQNLWNWGCSHPHKFGFVLLFFNRQK